VVKIYYIHFYESNVPINEAHKHFEKNFYQKN
jgi:hypothetical protein